MRRGGIHCETERCEAGRGILIAYGIVVIIISFLAYLRLIHVHKQTLHVRRIQILNLRLAVIVPFYSIVFYLILLLPQIWSYFDALINLIEGYCIFAFYKMLQLNACGPEGTIAMIKSSEHTAPCYGSCQKGCPKQCYSIIHILLYQFMTLRPLMFLFIAILEKNPEKFDKLIRLLTALCIISLILAMLALLRIYHILADHAGRLKPTVKVLFVKGIVFMLVIQELVISSYQKTGIFQGKGEDLEQTDTTKFDRYRQFYALAGLCEMLVLSFVLKPVFSIDMDEEDHKSGGSGTNLTTQSENPPDNSPQIDESYASFVCEVFKFWTVIFSDEHDNQTKTISVEIPSV
mmetsp:Transcript_19574/g.20279  ORF Transcript_19574/g.20279 Transcript_19574/m.20279 type:complete len:347 (+) Transcript_19574:71-1111(+)